MVAILVMPLAVYVEVRFQILPDTAVTEPPIFNLS